MITAGANEIEDILEQYGVTETTLAPAEKEALDQDGYVVLAGVIDAEWLGRLRSAFERACGKEGKSAGIKESGTRHIDDLVNRDAAFDIVYTHPRILAAVYHVLRCPFRVGQMTGREPLPGYGAQGLHADWTARARREPFRIVTTIWLLEDFTSDNGATRVVPGTHRLLTPPPKSLADPSSRHPDQKLIVAEAGSVLVFNGHLWHSGTRNETNLPRRVLQCLFVGRDELRFGKIKVAPPGRLSKEARYLFGMRASERS
jgi:ectoine hydroxylase-related dioxygenase (phytanoyl-CoA dioxygenase family)